jgi:hypothetical protein
MLAIHQYNAISDTLIKSATPSDIIPMRSKAKIIVAKTTQKNRITPNKCFFMICHLLPFHPMDNLNLST